MVLITPIGQAIAERVHQLLRDAEEIMASASTQRGAEVYFDMKIEGSIYIAIQPIPPLFHPALLR